MQFDSQGKHKKEEEKGGWGERKENNTQKLMTGPDDAGTLI